MPRYCETLELEEILECAIVRPSANTETSYTQKWSTVSVSASLSRSHSLAFMIIVIGSWELKDVSEKTSDLFADIVADIIHVHVVRINRCIFESKIVDVVSVKRKKFERSGFGGKFENT